jgi:O-antigen/teichoic acid export membrane protein
VILGYIMVPYYPRLTLVRLAKIMAFSRWLLASGVIGGLNQRLTNLILGRVVSVESLAFYNLADEVSSLITTEFHAPVRRALYPGYAKIANDRAKLSNAYVEVYSLLALISLPLVVGVAFLGQQIVLLFLGSKWAATGSLLQILCVAGIFRCFNTGGSLVYLVMGRPYFATGMAVFRLCTLAPSLYFAARSYGVNGAAWAVAATAGLFLIVEVTVETRFLGIGLRKLVAASWRTVAATGVMSTVVGLLRGVFIPDGGFIGVTIGILLVIVTGAVVYVGTLLGLWVMSGRPEGPEMSVLGVARRIALTLRK